MAGFMISLVVEVIAVTALALTIRFRKRIEFSAYLFLIAFEVILMIAAGWVFICYGAVIEMSNI